MSRLADLQNVLEQPRVSALEALGVAPVLDSAGHARVVAGSNALVAQLRQGNGRQVALRIVAPGADAGDWSVRYSALAAMQAVEGLRRLPLGIRRLAVNAGPVRDLVPGARAAQLMEWIGGPTLLAAIERAARAGNADVIRALATGLVQMWNDLQPVSFVHADLTAQNVMVRGDGQLVLVDLDSASWDSAPFGPGPGGRPGYVIDQFEADAVQRDAFAMLVIQASLRAIADNPGLRARFGDAPARIDGTLLFSAFDLNDPARSLALAEARHHARPDTLRLLEGLVATLVGGKTELVDALDLVPNLRVPVALTERSGYSTWLPPQSGWGEAPSPDHHSTWSTPSEVDVNLPSRPASESSWNQSWQPAGPEASLVDESEVAPRLADLRAALDEGNESEVIRLWAILAEDDHAALVAAEVEDVIATGYERRLKAEAAAGHDPGVVTIADEWEQRLIPLGAGARDLSRQAQERLDVRADLDAALAAEDDDALAELAISGRLVVLGDTDRGTLRKVLQSLERPALLRAFDTDDDHLILEAWDPELFDQSDGSFLDLLDRVQLAETRVNWLRNARSALKRRNPEHLRDLLLDPPYGAIDRLSAGERRRMLKTIESRKALDALRSAVDGNDDAAVITALNAVERIGARIEDRATWQKIQRVVERISAIEEVVAAAEAQPPDHARLAHLLPTIRALGLQDDPRLGGPERVAEMEIQVVRFAHLRRIRAAIARDNDIAILAAVDPDPHNATALLTDEERDRVGLARRSRRRLGG